MKKRRDEPEDEEERLVSEESNDEEDQGSDDDSMEEEDDGGNEPEQDGGLPKTMRLSDEKPKKAGEWKNKQRVLIVAARGITARDRHLMLNISEAMPHSKREPKVEKRENIAELNEICEMRNCNKCLYFETMKKRDTYLWVSNIPHGPSIRFLVENIHTMEELRMTGNCLKASRPLLSFDKQFDESPALKVMKEVFTQTFGTPQFHPKSQPFYDHVFTFSWLDNRVWFRNYQIVDEEKGTLAEIGPRFVLNPIKILEGSFRGEVLWSNPHYVTPSQQRAMAKLAAQQKYKQRVVNREITKLARPEGEEYADLKEHLEDVFETKAPEEAKGAEKSIFKRNPPIPRAERLKKKRIKRKKKKAILMKQGAQNKNQNGVTASSADEN